MRGHADAAHGGADDGDPADRQPRPVAARQRGRQRSFVGGIDDAVAITEFVGDQLGIQVNVTPLGARRLLGLPMVELARQIVPLEALLGPDVHRLVERLNEAPDWAARFGAEVGLAPKAVARIMRFERVTARLRAQQGAGLAEIAYACGYADQAHLNRDFRAFAATTPTDFVARLLPDGAGVAAAGDFPNVQDGLARAA